MDDAQLSLYIEEFKRRISTVIRRFRPDIIECQHLWTMAHSIMELGHPFICTAHHSDQLGFHYDSRMQEYAVRAAQAASYIFAISEQVRDEVIELYGVAPEKVVVLGNGYDSDTFRPQPVDRSSLLREFHLNIPANAPPITFAGKLSKTKGADILLLANRIVQSVGEAHLLPFGAGELQDVLDEDKLDRYCLDNVHLIGHQPFDVLSRFHNIARLSVLPSRSEGFGIGALEAMGCGIPVVVTRTGGPDTFAVWDVVEPEEPEQLANAILRVLAMPDDQYKHVCEQAQQVARQYSWEWNVETRLGYYDLAKATF